MRTVDNEVERKNKCNALQHCKCKARYFVHTVRAVRDRYVRSYLCLAYIILVRVLLSRLICLLHPAVEPGRDYAAVITNHSSQRQPSFPPSPSPPHSFCWACLQLHREFCRDPKTTICRYCIAAVTNVSREQHRSAVRSRFAQLLLSLQQY